MTDAAYLGPDADLLARIDRAFMVDPAAMPEDTFESWYARRDRLVAVTSFSQLSPEDQDWLNRACLAVSAGASRRLQNPDAVGGDWAAEDAALDAGEPVAVTTGDGDAEPVEEGDVEDLDPEVKALPVDDDGWVG